MLILSNALIMIGFVLCLINWVANILSKNPDVIRGSFLGTLCSLGFFVTPGFIITVVISEYQLVSPPGDDLTTIIGLVLCSLFWTVTSMVKFLVVCWKPGT